MDIKKKTELVNKNVESNHLLRISCHISYFDKKIFLNILRLARIIEGNNFFLVLDIHLFCN